SFNKPALPPLTRIVTLVIRTRAAARGAPSAGAPGITSPAPVLDIPTAAEDAAALVTAIVTSVSDGVALSLRRPRLSATMVTSLKTGLEKRLTIAAGICSARTVTSQ